jgi:hypothetical protein
MELQALIHTYTNVTLSTFYIPWVLMDAIFFEQRYHAYFMEDLKSWMVISAGLSYIYVIFFTL